MESVAGLLVDPAEDQRRRTELQLAESVLDRLLDHIALVARLGGAAAPDLNHAAELPRPLARLVEEAVGTVDVGLLGLDLGVSHVQVIASPGGP